MIPKTKRITEPEEYKSVVLNKRQPYVCPVCGGAGTVPVNFYTPIEPGTGPAKCRACNGFGIIWG